MKRIFSLLLCVMMIFVMAACSNGNDQVAALEARIKELESATAATQAPQETTATTQKVIAVNAVVYPVGGDQASATAELEITGPTTVIAAPVLPEGRVVRLWSVNGQEIQPVENQALQVEVDGPTVIKAVLRDELKVTSINAYMQFLDEDGDPTGEKFDEYVFEYDDENVSNKLITVYVKAEIPSGYTVDYWKINEVPYFFNKTVTAFTVKELDETTVYEVVLKKASSSGSTPTSTPSPTVTPTTPSSTPVPTETPTKTFIIPSLRPITFIPLITPTPTPIIVK